MKKNKKKITTIPKSDPPVHAIKISERLKALLKMRGKTFNELAAELGVSSTGLYLSFKRGKVTLVTLEKIANILNVHPFYFFEAELVERTIDEILKHPKNPNLKEFMFEFSRNVAKGMKLEDAIGQVLAPL